MEWVVVFALIVLWACLGASWHTATHPTWIIYSRDFLLSFKASADTGPPTVDLFLPDNTELYADSANGNFSSSSCHKIRKRGRRGGVRQGNAQSLRNKTDDLQALVRYQHEYKNACILDLTETWLGEMDMDSDLTIDGFGLPLRMDRDASTTGKTRGGGVCLYINDRWCRTTLVREQL